MTKLNIGDQAPGFTLPTNGGGKVSLQEYLGKKVVLYFYPKDNTQTCTIEAVDFSQSLSAFQKADTVVIGVSPDSVKSHDKFCAKHDLGIILAADEDKASIESYSVWAQKQMFGVQYMGVVRTTFLIGADGRIARIWDKIKIKGHVEDVLAAARAL